VSVRITICMFVCSRCY